MNRNLPEGTEVIGRIGDENVSLTLGYGKSWFMLFYYNKDIVEKLVIASITDSIESKDVAINFWNQIKEKYEKDIPSIEPYLFSLPKKEMLHKDGMLYSIEVPYKELESIIRT